MSGYPGQGYPQQGAYAPQPGQQQGGYPGAPPAQGGYPGAPPAQGGYPGAPPAQGGYPGAPPAQGGYPGAPPAQGGYGAAPPPSYQQQPQQQQQGGYGQPPQPQADPQVAQWFRAVDSDNSGSITAPEMQKALVNGNWSNFSEEACRMMIAFQQMGYRFTPTFVQNLLAKYDPRTRRLTLDNFIVACVQIKRLTDGFRARDREMRGQASLAYEDFVGLALGAHK